MSDQSTKTRDDDKYRAACDRFDMGYPRGQYEQGLFDAVAVIRSRHDDLRKRVATVLQDMQSIIDYLASPCPTTDMPNKRSRLGVESGELPGYPGAWDGGKLWTQTDERIAVATSASDDLLNDIDSIRKEIDP